MADIDIQEKKGSPWPWIIGLLALVLIVWVGYEMLDDDGDQDFAATTPAEEQPAGTMQPAPATVAGVMPAEVERFEQECAQGQTADDMSRQHEYAQTCVRHLTAALDAVVEREQVNDQPLTQQLEQYRTRAAELTSDPASQEHSAQLDAIFDDAAALIARVVESRDQTQAGDAADRVQEAADAFSAEGTVLDQQEQVATFFREAAAAIRQMADGQQQMQRQ